MDGATDPSSVGHSASDVERYTYCPLSWWQSREADAEDDATRRGEVAHAAKGEEVGRVRRLFRANERAVTIALYLALLAGSAAVLAVELEFLDLRETLAPFVLVMGLLWTLVALVFFLRSLLVDRRASQLSKAAGLVEGKIAYSDLDRPGALLVAKKFELAGRPDYVVRANGKLVPVELKTGKPPRRPHESHLLQVGAYCLLVEEAMGERPDHGVLQYGDRQYEVPYTEEMRDRVLETILRMRLAEATGVAHRNHDSVAKCRHCSRREGCPERLA
jgi:CRISPR-associated exonuclease Cas4